MCGCVTSANLTPTSPDVIPLEPFEPMTSHVAKHLTSHLALPLHDAVSNGTPKRYTGTSMDDVIAMRCYGNQQQHQQTERRKRSTSMECTCRVKHTPTHRRHFIEEKRSSWGLDSLRRFDSPPPGGQLDDAALQQASWYQAGIPREIALEILSQEDIGSFIVRDSTTHQNCYALSVRVPKFENPTGISHYLIKQTPKGGYMLKGLDKEWPSLTSLVTHHTVMQEKLPCTLRLPRNTQNPTYHDVDPDHQDQADPDDDYQRLSDFTSMMADLNMEK